MKVLYSPTGDASGNPSGQNGDGGNNTPPPNGGEKTTTGNNSNTGNGGENGDRGTAQFSHGIRTAYDRIGEKLRKSEIPLSQRANGDDDIAGAIEMLADFYRKNNKAGESQEAKDPKADELEAAKKLAEDRAKELEKFKVETALAVAIPAKDVYDVEDVKDAFFRRYEIRIDNRSKDMKIWDKKEAKYAVDPQTANPFTIEQAVNEVLTNKPHLLLPESSRRVVKKPDTNGDGKEKKGMSNIGSALRRAAGYE
jgi:hypothetical protein